MLMYLRAGRILQLGGRFQLTVHFVIQAEVYLARFLLLCLSLQLTFPLIFLFYYIMFNVSGREMDTVGKWTDFAKKSDFKNKSLILATLRNVVFLSKNLNKFLRNKKTVYFYD